MVWIIALAMAWHRCHHRSGHYPDWCSYTGEVLMERILNDPHPQRMCQYKHNAHLGSVRMAFSNLRNMETSTVISVEARTLASQIAKDLRRLEILVRAIRINADGSISHPKYKVTRVYSRPECKYDCCPNANICFERQTCIDQKEEAA